MTTIKKRNNTFIDFQKLYFVSDKKFDYNSSYKQCLIL